MRMTKKGEGGNEYKKGLWTVEEDKILMDYVKTHGKGQWNRIAKKTGLKRCGKSCRLRWMNYLSPNVKRGNFTEQEEDLIIRLHKLLGNRWSLIAKRVPGRTDNQVKNYWNTHLSKKLGIKEHQTSKLENGESSSHEIFTKENEEDMAKSNPNPSGNGAGDMIAIEIAQNKGIDEFIFSDNQTVPGIEEGNNYINSLWIHHDDFEFSTLNTMMNFVDGYYF